MAGREAARRARREQGLKKKAAELATLCGIDVCIIVRGKDGSLFFSTDDVQEARRIAQRYVDSVAVGEKSKKRECPAKGGVFCGSHSGQRKRQKKEYSCVAASSKSKGMAEDQVRNAGEDTFFSPSLLRELEFLLKTSPDIPHPEAFSAGKVAIHTPSLVIGEPDGLLGGSHQVFSTPNWTESVETEDSSFIPTGRF